MTAPVSDMLNLGRPIKQQAPKININDCDMSYTFAACCLLDDNDADEEDG
jgi:hypothetical protein